LVVVALGLILGVRFGGRPSGTHPGRLEKNGIFPIS